MGSCGSAGIKHATEGGEIENVFSWLFFQVTCPKGTWKYWKYQQQIKKKNSKYNLYSTNEHRLK